MVLLCGTAQANPKILDRFHKYTSLSDGELVYDIFQMGDDALPFLIKNITHEDHQVRKSAFHFIENYYPEAHALSAMTVLFLHESDSWTREKAGHVMAHIDGEYTKGFMSNHLHADPETQRIAIDVLTKLKDERVIPFLVELLENPITLPERKRFAIYGLADFKDKRAIPALLGILKYPDNVDVDILKECIEKLGQFDDGRTIPILVSVLNTSSAIGRRISKSHSEKVINALSQSGAASMQELLETAQMTLSDIVLQKLLKVFRNTYNPALVAMYEKVCLETDNNTLKSALAEGLKNMGAEGLKALLIIVKQKPCKKVLHSLASFNSADAVDAVASIALDNTSQLRIDAIDSFSQFGIYWNEEVSKHLPQLLEDPNSEVRLRTINLIRKMELKQMIPVLKQLTNNSKGNTRYAAYTALNYLLNTPPLELKIELNQQGYDYGEPIALTYTIRNVSDHPVRFGFRKTMSSSYIRLKIQQPDDTIAQYQGKHDRYAPAGRQDDSEYWIAMDGIDEVFLKGVEDDHFDILQPNEVLTDIISVTKDFQLFQSGQYTIQLKVFLSPWRNNTVEEKTVLGKRPPLAKKVKSTFMAWENTLISPKVQFDIADPTPEQINTMLTLIEPENFNNASNKQMAHVCFQLGELRHPDALTTLKKLNSIKIDWFSPSHTFFMNAVHRALLRYDLPELVEIWIAMLDNHKQYNEIVYEIVKKVGASGDERALDTIRSAFFKTINAAISFKIANLLSQLGDDSIINWLESIAYHNLHHWDRKLRLKGAIMLTLLNSSDTNQVRLPYRVLDHFAIVELSNEFGLRSPYFFSQSRDEYSLRKPWIYVDYIETTINWSVVREKATTVDGLKELLKHENQNIQRAAAYDLASLGNKSGIQLIEQDLHANEVKIRLHSRKILTKLRTE